MSKYINTQLTKSENILFDAETQQLLEYYANADEEELTQNLNRFYVKFFNSFLTQEHFKNFACYKDMTFSQAIKMFPAIAKYLTVEDDDTVYVYFSGSKGGYLYIDDEEVKVKGYDLIDTNGQYQEWGVLK